MGHRLHAPLGEEIRDIGVVLPPEQPCRSVLEQELHRLGRILLVGADHAARAALDPAGAVHTRYRRARVVQDTADIVPDRRPPVIERNAGHGRAPITDAAQHQPTRNHLALVGGHRVDPTARIRDQLVPDDLDRLDAAVAQDRHGRDAEAQAQRLRPALGRAHGNLAQQLDIAPRDHRVVLQGRGARGVQLQVGGVDHEIRSCEFRQLL